MFCQYYDAVIPHDPTGQEGQVYTVNALDIHNALLWVKSDSFANDNTYPESIWKLHLNAETFPAKPRFLRLSIQNTSHVLILLHGLVLPFRQDPFWGESGYYLSIRPGVGMQLWTVYDAAADKWVWEYSGNIDNYYLEEEQP